MEHHFNRAEDTTAGYSVVITGSNASQNSGNWWRWYAAAVSNEFNTPLGGNNGILAVGYNGRGDANLWHTNIPAILLEPLFTSNPAQAELIRSDLHGPFAKASSSSS